MPLRPISSVGFFLLLMSISVLTSIYAQENDSTAKSKRRKPLPFYFGKIGLDKDQQEKLYTIQESYEAKLEKLRQEMKALLAQRDAEMEANLTPGQKLRLQELQAAAKNKSEKGLAPAKESTGLK